ncbi:hypothetical protein D3C81_1808990 [compost metagenome]
MIRVSGLSRNAPSSNARQRATVCSSWMPVSTSVVPAPSASSQTLMAPSETGSGNLNQCTPGAIRVGTPGAGGVAQG